MHKQQKKSDPKKPPSLVASISINHTARFANAIGSSVAYNITVNDLLDLWCTAATATTGYRLFDAIRIKRIRMWFASNAASTSNSAFIEDYATGSSTMAAPSRTRIQSAVDFSETQMIVWKPVKFSVQASWYSTQTYSTNVVLRMSVPANAIFDVDFEAVLADGQVGASQTATAIAAGTAGQVYCRAFGCSTSTTALAPIGLASI